MDSQATVSRKLKLNIGSGPNGLPGYENLDRLSGQEAYPLAYSDSVADEIYASHVLEHFPMQQTLDVLRDWVRVLKPGCEIYLAVPDFDKIAKKKDKWRSHLMGGQQDDNDFHKAVFDLPTLARVMKDAGLENITQWRSQNRDCSRLPISLNLRGTKPKAT